MEHTLHLTPTIIPEIALRGFHVLILIKNARGNYILGVKDIYPTGIQRMLGGGMNPDEDPVQAAQRELQEETGLNVPANELKYLAKVTAVIDEQSTGQQYQFVTHLFFYQLGDQVIHPSDDIKDVAELNEMQLKQLIQNFRNLPTGPDTTHNFAWSWQDYGLLYSAIHQIALDAAQHVQ